MSRGIDGITCNISKYNAIGFLSLRPAHASSGAAIKTNSQKLGLKNAVTVRMNQTLRRREKSRSSQKRRAIGLANRKTTAAIARMTINALMLTVMIVVHECIWSCVIDRAVERSVRNLKAASLFLATGTEWAMTLIRNQSIAECWAEGQGIAHR